MTVEDPVVDPERSRRERSRRKELFYKAEVPTEVLTLLARGYINEGHPWPWAIAQTLIDQVDNSHNSQLQARSDIAGQLLFVSAYKAVLGDFTARNHSGLLDPEPHIQLLQDILIEKLAETDGQSTTTLKAMIKDGRISYTNDLQQKLQLAPYPPHIKPFLIGGLQAIADFQRLSADLEGQRQALRQSSGQAQQPS